MHPLEKHRKEAGLTRKELAERTGLATSTIERIEKGTSPYKTHMSVAILLADALSCEVTDLFKNDELSHLGRPPLTGRPITVQTTTIISVNDAIVQMSSRTEVGAPAKCERCNYVLPLTLICDNCD